MASSPAISPTNSPAYRASERPELVPNKRWTSRMTAHDLRTKYVPTCVLFCSLNSPSCGSLPERARLAPVCTWLCSPCLALFKCARKKFFLQMIRILEIIFFISSRSKSNFFIRKSSVKFQAIESSAASWKSRVLRLRQSPCLKCELLKFFLQVRTCYKKVTSLKVWALWA